eukprot:Opistho-2@30271
MSKADTTARKAEYFVKLAALFDEYPKIFIVGADNVGSNQMQQIRKSLRGRGVVLMGKNTMIRKAIRGHIAKTPELERLLPYVRGNVGFVFTKEELSSIRELVISNKVAAPAKAGALAPLDVIIAATNTGLGPEKTSFFQALSIPTKISRGTIEIISDVHLIKAGEKVGASEASLLNMLNISPFSYGLVILQVYENGTVFDPKVLDITDADLIKTFLVGVRNVASLSLQLGVPTLASIPHSLVKGYKNLLAVAIGTELTFPLADKVKEYLKNPSAFAVAAPAAAAPAAAAAVPKKEEKKEEKAESEEGDMGFGLFD